MALNESPGSMEEILYSGTCESIRIPVEGLYLLECWGAGGGGGKDHRGGAGGYAKGYQHLREGDTLYVCAGEAGGGAGKRYNGGGSTENPEKSNAGSGGGATHMAWISGTLAEIGQENQNRILLIAGGGGGGAGLYDGFQGGGESGGYDQKPADQTSGYAWGQGEDGGLAEKDASSYGGGAGGGGLYGGYAGRYDWYWGIGGGGGSGYTGGVPAFTCHGKEFSPRNVRGDGSSGGRGQGGTGEHGKARVTLVALSFLPVSVNGAWITGMTVNGETVKRLTMNGMEIF